MPSDSDPSPSRQLVEHEAVAFGRDDDRDVREVLGRRAQHRRAADVDVLDELGLRHAAPHRQPLERIEVDDHEVDRPDVAARAGPPASSGTSRRARMPPWIDGCSVFTRPPSISAAPVTSSTSVTFSPASSSAAAVPAEATSSMPRAARPFAKGTSPVLSDTDRSARLISVTRPPPDYRHPASLHPDPVLREGLHGLGQEPVLDRPEALVERLHRVIVVDGNRLLQEHRARVEPRVDEMDGHAGHPDAVAQGLADAVEAGERG